MVVDFLAMSIVKFGSGMLARGAALIRVRCKWGGEVVGERGETAVVGWSSSGSFDCVRQKATNFAQDDRGLGEEAVRD